MPRHSTIAALVVSLRRRRRRRVVARGSPRRRLAAAAAAAAPPAGVVRGCEAARSDRPTTPSGKHGDGEDRKCAVEDLLQPGIDIDHGREHRDEQRADDRAERRVDAADQHHDQNVQRNGPVELAGRDDAEEGEQPARDARHRRRDAEHADLDERRCGRPPLRQRARHLGSPAARDRAATAGCSRPARCASSSASITHQATGVPSNARLSGKSGNAGPSRPCMPPVIARSVASTVRTSVKTKVVIAK